MAKSSTNTTWRDVLPVHPAAELFPMMTDDELEKLAADIQEHDLRESIAFWLSASGEWFLLDGRNRLEAMERAGVRFEYVMRGPKLGPKVITWVADGYRADSSFVLREAGRVSEYCGGHRWPPVDPYAYVLSANVHRRHLTASQKRDIVAKILKAKPIKSDRQIAKQTGTSHPTVAKERAKLEQAGDVERVTTRTDAKGRKQPVKRSGRFQLRTDHKTEGAGALYERNAAQAGARTEPTPEPKPVEPKTRHDGLTPELRQLVKLLKTIKRDVAFLTDDDFKRLDEAQELFAGITEGYVKLSVARRGIERDPS
jgi:hypothetical protein